MTGEISSQEITFHDIYEDDATITGVLYVGSGTDDDGIAFVLPDGTSIAIEYAQGALHVYGWDRGNQNDPDYHFAVAPAAEQEGPESPA